MISRFFFILIVIVAVLPLHAASSNRFYDNLRIEVGQDLSTDSGAQQNLSFIGKTDWRVWSMSVGDSPSYTTPAAEKKDASCISDLTVTTNGKVFTGDNWPSFTWTINHEQNGVSADTSGIDAGFKVYNDENSTIQFSITDLGEWGSIRVYAGAWGCVGTLEVQIGDKESVSENFSNTEGFGWFDIEYSALTSDETMTITYKTNGGDMKFWGVALATESLLTTRYRHNHCLKLTNTQGADTEQNGLGQVSIDLGEFDKDHMIVDMRLFSYYDNPDVSSLLPDCFLWLTGENTEQTTEANSNDFRIMFTGPDTLQVGDETVSFKNNKIDSKWFRIGFEFTRSDADTIRWKLYFDSNNYASGSVPQDVASSKNLHFYVGMRHISAGGSDLESTSHTLFIDEIRLWDMTYGLFENMEGIWELTKDLEITDIHLANFDVEAGLAEYLKLNEGSGTQAQSTVNGKWKTIAQTDPTTMEWFAQDFSPESRTSMNLAQLQSMHSPQFTLPQSKGDFNFTIEFMEKHSKSDFYWLLNITNWLTVGFAEHGLNISNAEFTSPAFDYRFAYPNWYDDNQWNHWALTVDNQNRSLTCYCNGTLVGTIKNITPIEPRDQYGVLSFDGSFGSNAYFDEVRIWNGLRDYHDIVKYSASELVEPEKETNLLYYCTFNDQPPIKSDKDFFYDNATSLSWSMVNGVFMINTVDNGIIARGVPADLPPIPDNFTSTVSVDITPPEARDVVLWTVEEFAPGPFLEFHENFPVPPGALCTIAVKSPGWRLLKPPLPVTVMVGQNTTVPLEFTFDASYDLDSLPDSYLFRPGGEPITFNLIAPASGTYSMVWGDSKPKGAASFRQNKAFCNFSFQPSFDDKDTFTATFSDSIDSSSKTVSFVPNLTAIPEAVVINSDHSIPDPEDPDYHLIHEEKTTLSDGKTFNYTQSTVRDVTICGMKVVLDTDSDFADYFCSAADADAPAPETPIDIRNLTICADTVVIQDHMRVPGANVTIHARELIFKEHPNFQSPCLDTTPVALTEKAITAKRADDGTTTPGEDGQDGLKGGDITIYALNVDTGRSKGPLLLATGSVGQRGGEGIDGARGESCDDITKDIDYSDENGKKYYQKYLSKSSIDYDLKTIDHHQIIYFQFMIGLGHEENKLQEDNEDKNRKPGDGKPGVSPGQSGNGGNGGVISGYIKTLRSFAENDGGLAGETPASSKGGAAGTPTKWYKFSTTWNHTDGGHWDTISLMHDSDGSGTTKAGLDTAVDPSNKGGDGAFDPLDATQTPYAWLHPLMAQTVTRYYRDCMLAYHGADVIDDMTFYLNSLAEYAKANYQDTLTQAIDLDLTNLKIDYNQSLNTLNSMVNNQNSNLDYFGNPIDWAPMLAFSYTKDMYAKEINNAIQAMYLCYWLQNSLDDLVKRKAGLQQALDSKAQEVVDSQQAYSDANESLVKLQPEADKVTAESQDLTGELKQWNDEMEKMAEKKAHPWWKKMLDTFTKLGTAVCSFIPGPEGAIAKGVSKTVDTVVNDATSGKSIGDIASDSLKGVTDTFGSYGKAVTGETTVQALLGQITDTSKAKEYGDTLNRASKWTDLSESLNQTGDSVSAIINDWNDNTVNDADTQRVLTQMEASDQNFQDMKNKLSALLAEKQQLSQQIQGAIATVDGHKTQMTSDLAAMTAINDDLTAVDNALAVSPRMRSYLADMNQRAKTRLLKYHYYMTKAYQFRLLEPCQEDLNLQPLFDQFATIAETAQSTQLNDDQFKNLSEIFYQQLDAMNDELYSYCTDNSLPDSVTKSYSFTSKDLARFNQLAEGDTMTIYPASLVDETYENVRLVDIETQQIEMSSASGDLTNASMDIRIEHPGYSFLRKDAQTSVFHHYTANTEQGFQWTLTFDGNTETFKEQDPALAADSFLEEMLNRKRTDVDNELLKKTCYPALRVGLLVRKGKSINAQLSLDKLVFNFTFEYENPPTGQYLLTAGAWGDVSPSFQLNAVDANGRSDGNGSFTRIYTRSQLVDGVVLTAPENIQGAPFRAWTKADNIEDPEKNETLSTSPSLTFTHNRFTVNRLDIKADYDQYTVTGTIEDSDGASGELPYFDLTLQGTPLNPRDEESSYSVSTKSVANGTFIFPNLPAGSYTVTPSHPGIVFTPLSQEVKVSRGQSPIYTVCEQPFKADFHNCSISGLVSPDSGQTFHFELFDLNGNLVQSEDIQTSFSFQNLVPGTYKLIAPTLNSFSFTPSEKEVVVSKSNPDASGVDFAVATNSAQTVSGTISDSTKLFDLSNVTLSLWMGAEKIYSTTVDANGAFKLSNVYDGEYLLVPSGDSCKFSPAYIAVTVAGADVSDQNFEMVKGTTYLIAGRVLNSDGSGMGNVIVKAYSDDQLQGKAATDAEGVFSIKLSDWDEYIVKVAKSSCTFTPPQYEVDITPATPYKTDLTFTEQAPATVKNDFTGTGQSSVLLTDSSNSTLYAGSGEASQVAAHIPLGAKIAPWRNRPSKSELAARTLRDVAGTPGWSLAATGNFTGTKVWQSLWSHDNSGRLFADLFDDWSSRVPLNLRQSGEPLVPVGAGDFDGDGKDEPLLLDPDTRDLLVDLQLEGAPDAATHKLMTGLSPDWMVIDCEDFNGDDRDDILMTFDNGKRRHARIVMINGATVVGGGSVATGHAKKWVLDDCGDFNGDGKADLLWRDAEAGIVYLDTLANNGQIDSTRIVYQSATLDFKVLETGDYNGDGSLDFLIAANGGRHVVVVNMIGIMPVETTTIPITDDPKWRLVDPDRP